MSDIAIKIENISKQYRLGVVGTGTISHDLNRWWHKIRGLEDPYLKIGETNDRSQKATSDYVWALRDISFEVNQGDVLGIIGRNGAGKSTLLKILSRVTSPTTGSIKAKGRIASLLEVGTGFHPEMTGRENIFMNGSIMGMTKHEIKNKLDEIVDFSGVEKYLDTPVKRYSSGMIVRLGFAIAAHLEPEILVVDEVLAVGDAEFQKKAIGKMQDVSRGEGRTVLFVSHNMDSIRSLCTKGVILKNGMVYYDGGIDECIKKYSDNIENLQGESVEITKLIKYNTPDIKIDKLTINGTPYNDIILPYNESKLEIDIEGYIDVAKKMALEIHFVDVYGKVVFFYSPSHYTGNVTSFDRGKFKINEKINLPEGLNQMVLFLDIHITYPGFEGYVDIINNSIKLQVEGTLLSNGNVLTSQEKGTILLY